MKKQVLFIHGAGEGAYEADKKLATSLQHSLGPEYEVDYPAMPDEENTPYEQWKHEIEKELASMQQPMIDRMPVNLRGELLAGLAQSAQRLGDWEDAKSYLNQIVMGMAGTPYERKAKRWLDEPASAEKSALVCQTCHEPGRLENVLRALLVNGDLQVESRPDIGTRVRLIVPIRGIDDREPDSLSLEA